MPAYRFDAFVLTDAELLRNGLPVAIAPTPLHVLRTLIAHHPNVMSRDELQRVIWQTEVAVDSGFVARAVSRVREVLGDSAQHPRFIETLPKRGYRFIGAVTTERTSLEPLHPGDRSDFVRDVTVTDGSTVRVGQRFTKIWDIQNVGTVPWVTRYVVRQGPPHARGRLQSEERTPIPDTLPGQVCRISIELTAPDTPGSCEAEWKMADEQGRLLLPNQLPIYVSVDVRV